jgi:hypothetical protein
MISIRYSPTKKPNATLNEVEHSRDETNSQWLARNNLNEGVILLGGNSLAHFRIRSAQAHLRSDLLPSYWSLAGLLVDAQTFVTVPLDLSGDISRVPQENGVQTCYLSDYDDPARFPNIAVVRFTEDTHMIHDDLKRLMTQRSIIDIPSLILPWLGYVWGASDYGNPLLKGTGLPSAVFVETMYGIGGVELTPGLSSSSSCPEAIWQSAKWWHDFYVETSSAVEGQATTISPTGSYALGQRSAAVVERGGDKGAPDKQPTAELSDAAGIKSAKKAGKKAPSKSKRR